MSQVSKEQFFNALIMTEKERFEILVDEKFMEALSILAKRTKKSRADVIRDALNYYENALNEWERKEKATANL